MGFVPSGGMPTQSPSSGKEVEGAWSVWMIPSEVHETSEEQDEGYCNSVGGSSLIKPGVRKVIGSQGIMCSGWSMSQPLAVSKPTT